MMGGIPDSGSDTIVIVGMRGSKRERITVDLPSLFSPQGQDKDPLILPGDVIWVDRAAMVYLQGEIGRPGALRWDRNQTLQQVIALAGGISPRGTLRGLKIHRRAANGQVETIEDPSLHEPPQAGDVIIIPESLF
jgi:polysaccharide export outer membrane protein